MPAAWDPDTAHQAAQAFLWRTGLSEPQARLLRFYQNAIFHLPDNRLALRIYGPEAARKRAELMVAFSRFLAVRGFPSVRPSARFPDQPLEILGTQVSVWDWIDEDPEGIKHPYAFGALLRALHTAGDGADFAAGPFDPVAKIGKRLARLAQERRLPGAHLGVLRTAFARVGSLAAELAEGSIGAGLLHGDALMGNTLLSGGRLVLIDFDSVGYGAREWDLAPTFVAATRFRRQESMWRDFLAGYGVDAGPLDGLRAAGVVKQLSMTVAPCLSRGLSPAVDAEIDLRIRCWADWDFETPWHSPALRPAP